MIDRIYIPADSVIGCPSRGSRLSLPGRFWSRVALISIVLGLAAPLSALGQSAAESAEPRGLEHGRSDARRLVHSGRQVFVGGGIAPLGADYLEAGLNLALTGDLGGRLFFDGFGLVGRVGMTFVVNTNKTPEAGDNATWQLDGSLGFGWGIPLGATGVLIPSATYNLWASNVGSAHGPLAELWFAFVEDRFTIEVGIYGGPTFRMPDSSLDTGAVIGLAFRVGIWWSRGG